MLRYAIHNGLAVTSPDLQLSVSGAPADVAFDAHGRIFVDNANGTIFEYGVSARGFGPLIATRLIPNYAGAFTVDADGYIYAAVGNTNQQIAVAAPNGTPGLHYMSLPDPAYPKLQVDTDGEPLSLANIFGISVIRHPHVETVPDKLLAPTSAEFLFFGDMATAGSYIIVRWISRVIYDHWQDGDLAILNRLDRSQDQLYQTRDCFLQGDSPGPMFGLAEVTPYIYLSCQFPYAVVYV